MRRLRLAAELRELRERAGSRRRTGQRSHVHRRVISKLGNARVAPSQEHVRRLLDVLGVEGTSGHSLCGSLRSRHRTAGGSRRGSVSVRPGSPILRLART
ncbi:MULTISPECIES: helix-turn-helix domain-containing protein [Actinomadura]|uniref:Helix-turn-helix domain-containing protein n=1 Tax=Actinomadura yumaensis TaxID=111807 RepID=A0ABW2CF83_9ACTN|nr:helix-turn-helix domain-containing protein [Actinomadura sp. J1-007]